MNEKKRTRINGRSGERNALLETRDGGKYAGTALPLEEKQLPALIIARCDEKFSCPEESVPTI